VGWVSRTKTGWKNCSLILPLKMCLHPQGDGESVYLVYKLCCFMMLLAPMGDKIYKMGYIGRYPLNFRGQGKP